MKKYIVKFETVDDADNYEISNIPFTTTVVGEELTNLTCNEENKKIVVDEQGNISIVDDIPADDEIWYTSSDRKIVTPYNISALPEIVSNTYVNGKGVIKFATDVTRIGAHVFDGCSTLTSIIIPNSVISFESDAFAGCINLTKATLSNQLSDIPMEMFSKCASLISINIPESVLAIHESAFNGCENLTTVILPNNLDTIDDKAFFGCTKLSSINISDNVTQLGLNIFANCISIKEPIYNSHTFIYMPPTYSDRDFEYEIPDGIVYVLGSSFYDCNNLSSIIIPDSVTEIGDGAFIGCTNLYDIDLGNSLTHIGYSAFNGCVGVGIIDIPASVKEIGDAAFKGCYGREYGADPIICRNPIPPSLGQNVFYNTYSDILVPSQSVDAYRSAEGWSEYANRIKAIQ